VEGGRARREGQELNDWRSQRERMLAGDWYIADDPELVAERQRAATLVHQFNTSDPADPETRQAVLRELLGLLGEGADIRPPI
jgi:maltose O-acetyltransferase